MVVKASFNGSYPRTAGLARLYSRLHSGRLSEEGFEKGIRAQTARLFKLFKASGVTVFTDGMLRWDDILNPLTGFVDGVRVNGLVRFYDNNFFVRAPVIEGELRLRSDNPVPEWFETALSLAEEVFGGPEFTLKQPLPGPLTLAEFSVNKYYKGYWSLVEGWREGVLEPLIRELVGRGLKVVEIHEPALTWPGTSKAKLDGATAELGKLIRFCRDLGADVWVLTYFGYLGRVGKYLSRINEAVIGIDPHVKGARKAPHRLVKDYGLKRVMLGYVDARNTKLEEGKKFRSAVKALIRAGAEEVYVGNNAPMDFLPEPVAAKKVRRLGRLTSQYFGGGK